MHDVFHIELFNAVFWQSQNTHDMNSLSCTVRNIPLPHALIPLSFLQEWETKAGEAKREYDKLKREYKESGGGSSSAPKK